MSSYSNMDVQGFRDCIKKEDLSQFISDCIQAFNCTVVNSEDSNYSSGETYFQYCDAAPRLNLEAYAKSIFEFHTKHLTFDRRYS